MPAVLRRLILTLMVLLAVASPSFAQTQPPPAPGPKVIVRVVDAQQLPLPGAVCTLQGPGGAPAALAVSDGDGIAALAGVPGTSYTLLVQMDGFESLTRGGVVVQSSDYHLDAVLLISHLAQTVVVSAPDVGSVALTAGSAPPAATLVRRVLQRLPLAASTIQDALPLVPGVLRSATGELSFKGGGEPQNGLLVNGVNGIDPGTGGFRLSLPVDSVEAVQVFLHPYAAEYGLFTGGLTRVETRPGGDHWHFELNDFLPDPRIVNGRLMGIAEDAPHLNMNGPLFGGRATLSQSAAYSIAKRPVRGLDFPDNETRRPRASDSFTQLDFSVRQGHRQTAHGGLLPRAAATTWISTCLRRSPATPNLSRKDFSVTFSDNSQLLGGLLTSSLSTHRFDVGVSGQGADDMVLTPAGTQGNYFSSTKRLSSRTELLEVYALPDPPLARGARFQGGARFQLEP